MTNIMSRHQHRFSTSRKPGSKDEKVNDEKEGIVERFDKAFLIAMAIFAVLFVIVFIPILGPILALTIVPYLAGYQSGKYINRKDGLLIAIIVAVIWTIIEVLILFILLSSLNLGIKSPGLYTSRDWILLFLIFFMNILFCSLGSWFSPREDLIIADSADS